MTNDGDFCLPLTHPRYGVRKYYRVTVKGRVDPEQIAPMTRGVIHDGEKLRAERARVLSRGQGSSLLEVELLEGKNREVRRLCETLGLEVLTLQRTQIGPIKLGELRVGRWRALSASEITALLRHDPPAAPARRAG